MTRRKSQVQAAVLLAAASLAAVGCNAVLGIKEKHYVPLAAAGSGGNAGAKDAGVGGAAGKGAAGGNGGSGGTSGSGGMAGAGDAGPSTTGPGAPTLAGGIVTGGEPRTNAVGYTLLDDGFETSDFVSNPNGYQLSGGIVP